MIISKDEYNDIMRTAKLFLKKKSANALTATIHLTKTTATITDGYKICEIKINPIEPDDEVYYLPIQPLIKNGISVSITQDKNHITIDTYDNKIGVRRYDSEPTNPLSIDKLIPQDAPVLTYGFCPTLLSDTLKAFKDDKTVKIECNGNSDKGFVITGKNKRAYVLPVHFKK